MAHVLDSIAKEYAKLQNRFKIREAAEGLTKAKVLYAAQKAAIGQMLRQCPNGFNQLYDYYYRIEQACLALFKIKDVPDKLLKEAQAEYRLASGMRMFLDNLKKP